MKHCAMKRYHLLTIVLLIAAVEAALADDIPSADELTQPGETSAADTVVRDLSRPLQKVQRSIKYTIRGFDRLEDEYIEPQHYEWSVMLQARRNFEEFILSSSGQSIMFSPDQRIKVGPYFGWRWFFLGWTFDLKNLDIFSKSDKREIDFSIYSSQVGVDLFPSQFPSPVHR